MFRKATYALYPSPAQEAALLDMKGLHQRLYNAALEQRIGSWRQRRVSVRFGDQCRDLTALRAEFPEYKTLNAQSAQVTLKRLDLAFQHFFRRVKKGETPGFPRFKPFERFPGWGYKTHGDGFRFEAGEDGKHGWLRLSGVGRIKARGKARTPGNPVSAEVLHKADGWYLSLTLECAPTREGGTETLGLDWGVADLLAVAREDGGIETIPNPRYLRKGQAKLRHAQKALSRCKRGSKRRKKAKARLGRCHLKVARQRLDCFHKLSASLIQRASLLAWEALGVKAMTGKGTRRKAGLNRSILDAAPGLLHHLFRYKAEEAGIETVETPTKDLKPTQRCSGCWGIVPKTLSDREHRCPHCGLILSRDGNAARVNLTWALAQTGREPAWRGEVVRRTALPDAASAKRETRPIAS